MTLLERLGLGLMHRMDPEAAHGLAIRALNMGLGPKSGPVTSPRLRTTIAGLDLANPVGLAAGFDKDARWFHQLPALGFSHIEIGTITGQAQPGNPQPRMFRAIPDQALINRMGFNNDGAEALASVLKSWQAETAKAAE